MSGLTPKVKLWQELFSLSNVGPDTLVRSNHAILVRSDCGKLPSTPDQVQIHVSSIAYLDGSISISNFRYTCAKVKYNSAEARLKEHVSKRVMERSKKEGYFCPRQLRGPREKLTNHLSRFLPFGSSQRSGLNSLGSSKIVALRCTKWLLISTTVYHLWSVSEMVVQGLTWRTPPGTNFPDKVTPASGTTLGSGDATPGLIRSASLITALWMVSSQRWVRLRELESSQDMAAVPMLPKEVIGPALAKPLAARP